MLTSLISYEFEAPCIFGLLDSWKGVRQATKKKGKKTPNNDNKKNQTETKNQNQNINKKPSLSLSKQF